MYGSLPFSLALQNRFNVVWTPFFGIDIRSIVAVEGANPPFSLPTHTIYHTMGRYFWVSNSYFHVILILCPPTDDQIFMPAQPPYKNEWLL